MGEKRGDLEPKVQRWLIDLEERQTQMNKRQAQMKNVTVYGVPYPDGWRVTMEVVASHAERARIWLKDPSLSWEYFTEGERWEIRAVPQFGGRGE